MEVVHPQASTFPVNSDPFIQLVQPSLNLERTTSTNMSFLPRQQPIDFDAYDTPAPSAGNASTGSTSGTKRGRDGKEKESFKCPHPGCGQAYSRMEYMKRHQRKRKRIPILFVLDGVGKLM